MGKYFSVPSLAKYTYTSWLWKSTSGYVAIKNIRDYNYWKTCRRCIHSSSSCCSFRLESGNWYIDRGIRVQRNLVHKRNTLIEVAIPLKHYVNSVSINRSIDLSAIYYLSIYLYLCMYISMSRLSDWFTHLLIWRGYYS